jgi:hypothetical protein
MASSSTHSPWDPKDSHVLAAAPEQSDVESEGLALCNCLSMYKVPNTPDSIYYIPNFVTDEEASELTSQVHQHAIDGLALAQNDSSRS